MIISEKITSIFGKKMINLIVDFIDKYYKILDCRYFIILVYIFILQITNPFGLNAENCEYKFVPGSMKVKWRAYKFSERVGLEGTFEKIQIQSNFKSITFEEFAESVKFSIDTNSITTKNELRDNKIKAIFFANLIDGSEISGEFRNLKKKPDISTIDLLLKLNQKELIVPFELVFYKKIVELKGKLNISQWNVSKAFDMLARECQHYLKGKDNVPKLWNDIDIYLYSELQTTCNN